MKIFSALSYTLKALSYGLLIAVSLLLLFPQLRTESLDLNIFSAGQSASAPASYASAVRAAAPAVVNIYSESIETNPSRRYQPIKRVNLGSGVIMDSRGYILTANHVINDADQIIVFLQTGQYYNAQIIGSDPYTDLAVLQVQASDLPVIPQNPSLNSFVGDVVLAIGNPHNLGQTVTQGVVSAVGRTGLSNTSYREFLQMDAAINSGNSGGALVNSNGELVGITSASFNQLNPSQEIQGIFFAVPYKLAARIMEKIINYGSVTRGWLGISAAGSPSIKGFFIDTIMPNSPALKAGLRKGDLVYAINDTKISSVNQALDIVAETAPGTVLDFAVSRNEQKLVVKVQIEALNGR